MRIVPGSRLGPYEITASIGAGGMGEVFRARDTKLNRDVAIKVLPAAFADDPERLARFTREAQTLASLNHPNIASIHGIEEVPAESGSTGIGSRALVMELVEGDDLSAHIARGPIPIAEALPIARQIAEAVEAAHEQGIVHRDLKPANIKVRTDGTVKVLDFGLAKAMDHAGTSSSNPDVSHSPTLTHQGTTAGMIIGTAAYMSPEQAKGKAVDKRADIWAFGVVLWETLTGARLFKGDDVSDTLAAVLRQDIDVAALPADTPPSVRRLVARCLDRDLKRRLRDIGEARVILDNPTSSLVVDALAARVTVDTLDAPPRAPAWRRALPWAAGAVMGAGLMALMMGTGVGRALFGQSASELVPVTSTLLLPEGVTVATHNSPARSGFLAVSRDGRQVAFVGQTEGRGRQIFIRSIDSPVSRPVAGTEGGDFPTWSPDGRRIAFSHAGKLKHVPSDGGIAQVIADMVDARSSATWGLDDTLLFHNPYTGPIKRVSSGGGPTTDVLEALGENQSWFSPVWLPDGRRFLVVRFAYADDFAKEAGIYAGSIGSKDLTLVVPGRIAEVTFSNDEIFYREGAELIAQPFDPRSLKLSGNPRVISNHASMIAAGGPTLVYFDPPGGLSFGQRITWLSRSGAVLSTTGAPGSFRDPRISPDGRSLAIARADRNGVFAIWKYEVARDVDFRVSGSSFIAPIWSRDGRSIISAQRHRGILQLDAFAFRPPQVIRALKSIPFLLDVSPDGREVLIRVDVSGKWQLATMPIDGSADPQPISDQVSQFASRAAFSPDGKWIAVDAGLRLEVWPHPGPGSQIPVTAMEGAYPRWRGDGRELFFGSLVDGQPAMMAAPVIWNGGVPDFGPVQMLFKAPRLVTANFGFDVTPDGQRFVAVIGGDPDPTPLTLVIRAAVR